MKKSDFSSLPNSPYFTVKSRWSMTSRLYQLSILYSQESLIHDFSSLPNSPYFTVKSRWSMTSRLYPALHTLQSRVVDPWLLVSTQLSILYSQESLIHDFSSLPNSAYFTVKSRWSMTSRLYPTLHTLQSRVVDPWLPSFLHCFINIIKLVHVLNISEILLALR